MTQITQKEARNTYGIIVSKMQRLDKVKYYLKDNGNVIDSMGDIRYMNKDNHTCPSCNTTHTTNEICPRDIPF